MGRAHTHAITDAPIFFDLGIDIVKRLYAPMKSPLLRSAGDGAGKKPCSTGESLLRIKR